MENRKRILEKIEKLMSLGDKNKNSSGTEADLAIAKARELMMQFNISESDLSSGLDEILKVTWDLNVKTLYEDMRLCMNILSEFFMVKCLYTSDGNGRIKIVVVGRKHNIDIAAYVWDFLEKEVNVRWKKAVKEFGYDKSQWKSFVYGIRVGLSNKMQEQEKEVDQKQQWALVVVKESKQLETWVESNMQVKTTQRRSTSLDSEAYAQGKVEGGKIDIRKGIT